MANRLQKLVVAVLASGLVLPVAQAQQSSAPTVGSPTASPGAIVGLVLNPAKVPVARATVTAVRVGGGIRATVSGSDGIYSFGDLPPGTWSLSAQADGYSEVAEPILEVITNKATRHDIVLAGTPLPSGAAAPSPAAAAQAVPEALQAPEPKLGVDNFTPFAYGDFTWLNGSPRNHQPVFDTKFFTPDIRLDVHYMADFNHPRDHTIVGSTESFRSGEFQVEQISFG